MSRAGRNDPCPCGSGRKYKRCCLGQEASREAFARALHADVLPLLRELGRYAMARRDAKPEAVAAEHFSFWRPPLDRIRTARLLDFLIFDHRPNGARPAVAEYLAERGALLSAPRRALLEAWQDVAMHLYSLERWSGGFARCRPSLPADGAVIDVMPLEEAATPPLPARALALRALPVEAAFVYAAWPVTFGARSTDEVAAAIVARHHAYVRRERIVSLEEFLAREATAFDEEAQGVAHSQIIVPGRP